MTDPRFPRRFIECHNSHDLTPEQWRQLFTPADHARALRVLLARPNERARQMEDRIELSIEKEIEHGKV